MEATAPNTTLPVGEAWQPLPSAQWNADAARHLLRRAGWSAQPAEVERATAEGLDRTLERLFPKTAAEFPTPKLIANLQEDTSDFAKRVASAAPEEKRLIQKEARDRSQQAMQDMSIKWLQFAVSPGNSAAEKWVLFLSDIYVVSYEKVRNASLVYKHQATLRRHGFGPAPVLTKAVSRSPAMIQYLDLNQSKKDAPNENFARELFELFVLGEGHYTEADIKEAARAFTGYRQRFGEYDFAQRQHDASPKTVFGKTGNYTGDGIIDLAYKQSAAGTFLPHEMVRFYLTDDPLPPEYLAALGGWWQKQGYDLNALARRFFGSRLFFDVSYRGNYIKSPIQFYLGLVQDLQLDVAPLPRQVMGGLRQMGQSLFAPPNVRGWVGGRTWINSATLTARRNIVQALFSPLDENKLNADEQVELTAARAEGRDRFFVTSDQLKELSTLPPAQAADRLIETYISGTLDEGLRSDVRKFVAGENDRNRLERLRNTAVTLLQSPEYQLC